jgi:glycosyltransferase involved in cell wall biosynthesis
MAIPVYNKVMSARKKSSDTSGKKPAPAKKRKKALAAEPPKPAIDLQSLKVAIVCDWLTGTGGAERVVLELHRLFPGAPIYTSQYDSNPKIWYGETWFGDADVRTTWLQRLPKKLKKFLPVLRARAFSQLDLSEYDLVIASSSSEAKAVRTGPKTAMVWYCHAPTHYYWSRYEDYMKHPGVGVMSPLARLGLRLLVGRLRRWDHGVAQKPEFIIANSTHTQSEIKKYYGRESTVVFPPVDTGRFKASSAQTGGHIGERFGYVIAGRQTPYKRVDLAVEACSRLNLPLTVIGSGPDHDKLTAMAGQSVRFLNRVTEAEMAHHFKLANAFIFPNLDDFGIVAVEAMSAGTPVVAYKAGGALDYVEPGVTGEFFEEQTPESLMQTLRKFHAEDYDSQRIAQAAEAYSVAQFCARMTEVIQDSLVSRAAAEGDDSQPHG